MRKLLGGRPMRRPISVALGYDAAARLHPRGAHAVVHRRGRGRAAVRLVRAGRPADARDDPAARRWRAAGHQRARDGAAARRAPVGRRRRRPAGRWRSASLVSFSTQLGPVYLRVDRLGPVRHRRHDDAVGGAQPAASSRPAWTRPAPRGSPSTCETGPVSGGGTIQHDPATGDYVGVLVLRLGKRVTHHLHRSRVDQGPRGRRRVRRSSSSAPSSTSACRPASSRSTASALLYVADRTPRRGRRPRRPAVRAAAPHPVPGRPRQAPAGAGRARCARSSRRRTGTHIYGILVKLTFGSGHPLLRADLALHARARLGGRTEPAARARPGLVGAAAGQERRSSGSTSTSSACSTSTPGRAGARRRAVRLEAVRPLRADRRRRVPARARARGSRSRSAGSTRGSRPPAELPRGAAGHRRADHRRQPAS